MKNPTSRRIFSVVPFLFLGLNAQLTAQDSEPESRILDEIVAKVNNEIITMTDLNKSLSQLRTAMQVEFNNPQELEREFSKRRKLVLRTVIQNKIMVQKAEELGITSDIDLDVSQYLEEMRKEAGIPSLDVLDQYFRQRGSSLEEYRNNVKEQMITRSLLQQFVYSKITLLTPEVEAYYEENKARFTLPGEVQLAEILFLTEGKDKQVVRRAAQEALQRLENGETFGEVARDVSEGPTASRGGDIGTFSKGSMNDSLERVVFELPLGSYSEIIESDYGFQIVQVMNRTEARIKPLQDVRPLIAEALYEKKAEPEMREFLKTLYDESYIFVSPKYQTQYDLKDFGIEPSDPQG